MTKKLFATVLAVSMAFTAIGTAPARAADSGEIGRFLLGAGALFIIGNEIAKNDRRSTVTRRYVEPAPRVQYRNGYPQRRHIQRWEQPQPRYRGHTKRNHW